ncbi:MAG: 2-hydroxychromene-2-carboxylate isomerase [Pseudohongiella sp.]|nr:2-hydroxychromene-2-carboxylate isomerase [Pseudohongiella sp.]
MSKTIDYYLSLISPWSYLGHRRLLDIAAQSHATINIWPVDFSVIFPSTGGIPLPKRSPERKAYRLQELKRWRDYLKLPLTLEPKHFPVSDKLAASMVVNLRTQNPAAAVQFADACLRACWVEERDISDTDTLLALARENQLDGEALLSLSDAAMQTIAWDSAKAVKRGIFGAPSYMFDGELFWGQDRLEFLQRALQK